jgi:hypothetical protein
LWNGEEVVNDVDDATSEVDILMWISRAWAGGEVVSYSLSNGRLLEQARVEIHIRTRLNSPDNLTIGQVCVCGVRQLAGDERWCLCDGAREVCTIQDMVGEKSIDERSVVGTECACGWAREELGERSIVGSKERDIGQSRQLLDDLWVQSEVRCQVGEVRIAGKGRAQVRRWLRSSQRGESRQREELGMHFKLSCCSAS